MNLLTKSSLGLLPFAAIAAACSSPSSPAKAHAVSAGAAAIPNSSGPTRFAQSEERARTVHAALHRRAAVVADAAPDAGGVLQPPHLCRQPNGPVPERYKGLVKVFESDLANTPPGAAMAIIEHGRLGFAYAGGTKGWNSNEPVCPSSLFRIGSMTKALTATAFLKLVDQGKASLDDRLIDVAPDVTLPAGPEFSSLTIRQLLSQQSGVSDVTQDWPSFAGPTDDAYLSQYLTGPDFAQQVYWMNPPGSFFYYSNTNFMLAGLAVERVSGIPYPDAMRRFVTGPLGMDRTMFRPPLVVADGDYTNGSSTNPDGTPLDISPLGTDNAAVRPAGMEFTSVLDFAKFAEFVYGGNDAVMSRRAWRKLHQPEVNTDTNGDVDSYGLGLYVEHGTDAGPGAYYPGKRVDHTGAQAGWVSYWDLQIDLGFGFVIFQNTDGGAGFDNTLLYALRNLAGITPAAEPPSVAPVTSRFSSYAGSYNDPYNVGRVIVTDISGALTVAMPDLDAAGVPYDTALVPTTRDNLTMTIEGFPFSCTFVKDASGSYRWMRGMQVFVAERDAADAGAPADASAD
jgi:CubicO group peptidase (beta-lactamase class C family)